MIVRTIVTSAFAVLINSPEASTAAYPERPITMIVAFVPGGGTDIVARAMVPYLEKQLGGNAKIVVVNRPGAAGEIGFAALAAAAPDGYTIGFINSPAILTTAIEKGAPSLWLRLELIGNVIDDPQSFTVHADTPLKNLAELAASAKANPGGVHVGTTGGGIAVSLFGRAAGVKLSPIPFKGGGEVRTALAGKQIVVASHSIGEALQAVRGGTPMRILGLFSRTRSALAPDVPTAREQGFDVEVASLRGLAAPKGLPADVRERLVPAVAQVVADPEFEQKSIQYYAPLRYLSPAQFQDALKDGDALFKQVWKETPWSER